MWNYTSVPFVRAALMDSAIKDKALALDRGGQRIEAVKLLRQHLPVGTELAEVVELLTRLRTSGFDTEDD